jgi:glycosyltransferase involved in cell wall biosynthesis
VKIAHVTPYFHPEFYGSHEAFLSKELVRNGHEVTIFTTDQMPRWGGAKGLEGALAIGEEEWEGVRIVRLPAGPTFSFVPSLPQLPAKLAQGDFDLFLSHEVFSIVAWHSARAARRSGAPFVLVQHGYNGGRRLHFRLLFKAQFLLMGRRVLRAADAAISLTELGRDFLLGLGADSNKVQVHPTGVDCSLFQPSETQAKDGPLTFGALGRVDESKGVLLLLEAFAKACGDSEDRLVFAGTGNAQQALRARARELGLGDRVQLLGRLRHGDVPEFLASLSTLVIPTLQVEPFGIVAVEAAAAGTPVIASAIGGLKETVVDGETGLVIPAGDEDALVEAMQKLIGDRELLDTLGLKARERAEQHYDWPRITERFEALFADLTAARAAGASRG